MTHVTYELIKESYPSDTGYSVSYGILAYESSPENGTTTIIATVHNITSDGSALSDLVTICNRLNLSPIHLHDVVEDFLSI